VNELATLSGGWHTVTHHLNSWANSVADKGGAWVIFVLILASAGLIGYAVMVLISRPSRQLSDVVEPYRLRQAAEPAMSSGSSGGTGTGSGDLVTVPVLRRASQALLVFLQRRGWQEAIDQKLVRTGLPLEAGEFTLISLIVGFILVVAGLVVGGLAGLVIGLVIALIAPVALLEVMAERRSRSFNSQLPDVLQVLASTLRAGFSLSQGLDALVEDTKPPMNAELRRALGGARLGLPLEDALLETAERVNSPDFSWTVMAIRIQREVGGNLAEVLDTVAHTMIERGRLRREIKTLTAEGRISAIILGALPVLLGLFIFAVNRPYIDELFHSTPGEVALMAGLVLELLGAWWMYRTIQIEI
jgi:tight adherence protein B